MKGKTKVSALVFVTTISCLLISVQAFAESVQYTYDDLNRLIRTEYDNGVIIEYTYDGAGNRLTKGVSCSENTYFKDADGDGYGDAGASTTACSQPFGYVVDSADCNDGVAAVHPGAIEICNEIDDNCNDQIDEGVTNPYFPDGDSDGYGSGIAIQACAQPDGYAANSADCDDVSAAVHPGAAEICNNRDDDCDSDIDEGVKNTYYRDNDEDGFGDPTADVLACSLPSGYSTDHSDCDDNDSSTHPGAAPEDSSTACMKDVDGDNYGDANPSTSVTPGTDCNDADGEVNPGVAEVCNNRDDDCDSDIDEGVKNTYYRDNDEDGFGDPAADVLACSLPSGYSTDDSDCDDNDSSTHPGAAPEDSSTACMKDVDNDDYGDAVPPASAAAGSDCNDNDGAVNPASTEMCNRIDDNCSGSIDEGCPPTVSTGQATSIFSTNVMLNGVVNPNGADTLYRFEYGSSTNYTAFTDYLSAGSSFGDVDVRYTIHGLDPGSRYYFRLVAKNDNGPLSKGESNSFITNGGEDNLTFVEPGGACGTQAPCFNHIQEAVEKTADQGVIKVACGVYNENIVIEGNVTLEIGWNTQFTTTDQPDPVVINGYSE